jgi:hypothetical protein
MQLIKDGPINLYFEKFSLTNYKYNVWLCRKKNETAAYVLSAMPTGMIVLNSNQMFKKRAQKFFSDFPNITENLEKKVYTSKNIEKLVSDYNAWKVNN